MTMKTKFQIGEHVVDRDGFVGTITNITHHDGAHWYDVRFDRGEAVRYESDLRRRDCIPAGKHDDEICGCPNVFKEIAGGIVRCWSCDGEWPVPE